MKTILRSTTNQRPRKVAAFTLIELLTVIAIIGILAAILIPTVGKVRAQAKNTQCLSNLRQLGMGISLYAGENRQRLPLGFNTTTSRFWFWEVAQYLGDPKSGKAFQLNKVLTCPIAETAPRQDQSSYGANPVVLKEKATFQEGILLSKVLRPSEVIFLADSGLATGGDAFWGFYNQTNVFIAAASRADEAIVDDSANVSGGVIRWRHNKKAGVAFADGHVAMKAVGELKLRNLNITY